MLLTENGAEWRDYSLGNKIDTPHGNRRLDAKFWFRERQGGDAPFGERSIGYHTPTLLGNGKRRTKNGKGEMRKQF